MLAEHFLTMYPNLNIDIDGELEQLKVRTGYNVELSLSRIHTIMTFIIGSFWTWFNRKSRGMNNEMSSDWIRSAAVSVSEFWHCARCLIVTLMTYSDAWIEQSLWTSSVTYLTSSVQQIKVCGVILGHGNFESTCRLVTSVSTNVFCHADILDFSFYLFFIKSSS